jgi:hypothetical protein
LSDLLEFIWSGDLTVQENENSGGNGENRQNYAQAIKPRDKRKQTPGNQPDGQKKHTDVLFEPFHESKSLPTSMNNGR